jgi:hypothetical protein
MRYIMFKNFGKINEVATDYTPHSLKYCKSIFTK